MLERRRAASRLTLFVAFFVSGMAGLVYETVWTRYLGLFVGHSAYAQVIVLTVFLGGLSLGALLAGQFAERIRQPLLWYAAMELAVCVIGLSFHDVFVGVTGFAQANLFPALAGSAGLTAVKWGIASALIFPPAVLLGTTFPLMTSGMLRVWPAQPGRTLSLLYFSNSFGAAFGAILGGFVLVGLVGLPGTLLTAAVLNFAVAVAAWAVARGQPAVPAVPVDPSTSPIARGSVPPSGFDPWRLLLAVSFGTALASFIYEIAWIRMLSLVLGSATHSFEIMLSAFIFGLALGALVVQRQADREVNALRTLGLIQCAMGAAALATLPVYLLSFEWLSTLLGALAPNLAGYRLFSLGKYALACAVMLPSTVCAGMTLPLITRILLSHGSREKAVGWVYGINTLGSIVGVLLASLLLLPLLGLKALLITGACLDMALGIVLLGRWAVGLDRRPTLAVGVLAAGTVFAVLIAAGSGFDTARLNSGVYRAGRVASTGSVTSWTDGRTASVAVTQGVGFRTISTNGKPDASLSDRWIVWTDGMAPAPMAQDEPTQVLLPFIALAHRPDAEDAIIIGHGSGVSGHILLGSPRLRELVTVEIEPAMIAGSRTFAPANQRVFDDPRSTIEIDDAKSYFASSQRSFDLIVSEPSNPWVSGVASLFTDEFYQLVSRHLTEGGIFGQWLHLYEIDDALVLSVLAALHANFSSYELFRVHGADILIVASNDEVLPRPDWAVADDPGIASDLARTHPMSAAYLERSRFLTRDALTPLLQGIRAANSDFFPILDLGAEFTRFQGTSARGIGWAADGDFDPSDVFLPPLFPPAELGRTPVPAVRPFAAIDLGTRLRSALASPPDVEAIRADPELRTALADEAVLDGLMAVGHSPDWAHWIRQLRLVSARRHGGTRGWADDAFFDRMERFATAREAPEGLRTALRFERHVRSHDWAAVATAATALVPPATAAGAALDEWVDPQLTLDAGVMALLETGRPGEARRIFDALYPRLASPDTDFMAFLLPAYLAFAESTGAWRVR